VLSQVEVWGFRTLQPVSTINVDITEEMTRRFKNLKKKEIPKIKQK